MKSDTHIKVCPCGEEFEKPKNRIQKYCSWVCQVAARKPKTKYVIPNRSKKRAKQEAKYYKRVKEWKKDKMCAVYPNRKCVECHHMKGRIGDLLLDERFWLPVSVEGHRRIENNPDWAKENGYSLSRLAE